MAKKKKVVTTNAPISYSGNVEIKLMHGSRVYKTLNGKNSGYAELFRFLAYALINQYEPNARPKFIKLYYAPNQADVLDEEVTATAVPHSSVQVVEGVDSDIGAYADAVFEFLIPYGTIIGSRVNRLKVFNTDRVGASANDKASIILNIPEFTVSDSKTNLLVTWTLRISNQKSS